MSDINSVNLRSKTILDSMSGGGKIIGNKTQFTLPQLPLK